MLLRPLLLAILLSPLPSLAGSIYLCKAYNGGTFWSSAHCGTHNALIDSIVSVPDSLPFNQQVELAEQQRGRSGASSVTSTTTTNVYNHSTNDSSPQQRVAECKQLEARIAQLDSLARQPLPGAAHDQIRTDRKAARDRQFGLRC